MAAKKRVWFWKVSIGIWARKFGKLKIFLKFSPKILSYTAYITLLMVGYLRLLTLFPTLAVTFKSCIYDWSYKTCYPN